MFGKKKKENEQFESMWQMMGMLSRAHPWHGVSPGPKVPERLNCYVEVVPSETVKYEMDKFTGILSIDRPQMYSNVCPSPYGFIPQTYCSDKVAELCREKTGRNDITGDGDPLDICILTEKTISHGDILLKAKPVGGLRMIDNNEADDKIIGVLAGDATYGNIEDIEDVPHQVLDRLRHYFLTYKQGPDKAERICEITHVYGKTEAHEVIKRSQEDYAARFHNMEQVVSDMLKEAGRIK